jgi:hypothetical protein
MKKRDIGTLAVAFTLTAATAMATLTAGAAATDADRCREIRTAVISDGGIAPRAKESGNMAAACRAGVIRASFTAPRVVGDLRRPEPGERLPEPGRWATLLAGLLGAITIGRRRMS